MIGSPESKKTKNKPAMLSYKLYDEQVKAIEGRNTKYQLKIYRYINI